MHGHRLVEARDAIPPNARAPVNGCARLGYSLGRPVSRLGSAFVQLVKWGCIIFLVPRFDTTLSQVYRVMVYGIYPVFGLALLLAIAVGGTWARLVMFILGLLLLAYGWTMARNLRGVLEHRNLDAKPFVWTASVDTILAKLRS